MSKIRSTIRLTDSVNGTLITKNGRTHAEVPPPPSGGIGVLSPISQHNLTLINDGILSVIYRTISYQQNNQEQLLSKNDTEMPPETSY